MESFHNFLPKKIFLTKGKGTARDKLVSFEMALRDAGISHVNLVRVSSIYPPHCKLISRNQGIPQLKAGSVVFCVMSDNATNEPSRLTAASVGLALPADRSLHDRPLRDALAEVIRRMGGGEIPPDAWPRADERDHLRVRVQVEDAAGGAIAEGRDLSHVRRDTRAKISNALAGIPHERFNKAGLTDWTFGDLPESVRVDPGPGPIEAYPALAEEAASGGASSGGAAVRLFPSPEAAASEMRLGLRRLLHERLARDLRPVLDHAPGMPALLLHYATLGRAASLREQVGLLAADLAAGLDDAPRVAATRTRAAFERLLDAARSRLARAVNDACARCTPVLAAFHRIILATDGPSPEAVAPAHREIRAHAARLVSPSFIAETPPSHLESVARYLAGDEARLARLAAGKLDHDARCDALYAPHRARLELLLGRADVDPAIPRARAAEFRWLVEEYRLALFAPELRAHPSPSARSLDEAWERLMTG